jgi:hypothetical protein
MAWLFILLADVFELAWPFVLKSFVGLSKWSPLLAVALFTPSAFLLGHACEAITGRDGLRGVHWDSDGRHGNHWNSVLWRERERGSGLLAGVDRSRVDRVETVLRRWKLKKWRVTSILKVA